jgi:hypothetical protein
MPAEALQIVITTPMITAVSDPADSGGSPS